MRCDNAEKNCRSYPYLRSKSVDNLSLILSYFASLSYVDIYIFFELNKWKTKEASIRYSILIKEAFLIDWFLID